MSEFAIRAAVSRMHLSPVLIAPHCDATAMAMDLHRVGTMTPEEGEAKMASARMELCEAYGFGRQEQRKSFAFANGIAIIPVHGTLINRFGGSYGNVTGYNFLKTQVAAAVADKDVLGIVYDHNSYGGEAAGCFECSAELREMTKGKKPTIAVIDSSSYSASFAIASAADKRVITPSGGAGSIGVVAMHVDLSKFLEKVGAKITFIHAGEHKVDGNPFEPLPDSVKADIQKGVNATRDQFVDVVATNLGLDPKRVKATEAKTYRAEDAKGLGLVDAIATPSAAVQAFLVELSGSSSQSTEQEPEMAETTKPGADAASTQAADKAAADARTAERARISAITTSEEAKGRAKLASHLALNTSMSVDEAKAVLSASAAETTEAAKSDALGDAMHATGGGAQVGADAANNGGGQSESAADRLAANYEAAGGYVLKRVK